MLYLGLEDYFIILFVYKIHTQLQTEFSKKKSIRKQSFLNAISAEFVLTTYLVGIYKLYTLCI